MKKKMMTHEKMSAMKTGRDKCVNPFIPLDACVMLLRKYPEALPSHCSPKEVNKYSMAHASMTAAMLVAMKAFISISHPIKLNHFFTDEKISTTFVPKY